MAASIHSLDDHLLEMVFSYLESGRDKLAVLQTCRAWHRLGRETDVLWQSLAFRSFQLFNAYSMFCSEAQLEKVQRLSMRPSSIRGRAIVPMLLDRARRLRSLDVQFSGWEELTWAGIARLGGLTRLRIQVQEPVDLSRWQSLAGLPQLRDLEVATGAILPDGALAGLPGLTRLALEWLPPAEDSAWAVRWDMLRGTKGLQVLELRRCRLSLTADQAEELLPRLESLSLCCAASLGRGAWDALPRLRHLTSLAACQERSACALPKQSLLAAEPPWATLLACAHLQALTALVSLQSQPPPIPAGSLRQLSSLCLVAAGPGALGSLHLGDSAGRLPALRALRLRRVGAAAPHWALRCGSEAFAGLEELEVEGLRQEGGEGQGAGAPLPLMPRLTSLTLRDAAAAELPWSLGPGERQGRCWAPFLPCLEILDLTGCARLRRQPLLEALGCAARLHALTLTGCEGLRLRPEEAEALRRLPSLLRLELPQAAGREREWGEQLPGCRAVWSICRQS